MRGLYKPLLIDSNPQESSTLGNEAEGFFFVVPWEMGQKCPLNALYNEDKIHRERLSEGGDNMSHATVRHSKRLEELAQENLKDWAYFLGWMISDGNVSKNNNTVCIELQRRDEYILFHLQNLCARLGLYSRISPARRKHREYTRLRIYSWELVLVLEDYGIRPRKTETLEFRRYPERHFVDFLRGIIDGDGCLQFRKRKHQHELVLEIYCASRCFLSRLAQKVESHLGIKHKEPRKRGGCYGLSYYTKDALVICQAIYYPGCLSLHRKKEIFESYKPTPKSPHWWTEREVEFLKTYYIPGTGSWKYMAKKLGRSPKSISKKIWELKLNR